MVPKEFHGAGKPRCSDRRTSRLLRALSVLAVASAVSSSVACAGDLEKILPVDIKAGTLDHSLLKLSAQTHTQIIFPWNSGIAKINRGEIKGRYTGLQALSQLLSGTHLKYVVSGNTISIRIPPAKRAPAPRYARPESAAGIVSRKGMAGDPPPATDSVGSRYPRGRLSEIIVTAQKFRQRAFDVPISLDVVTAEELRRLNITSLNNLQYDVSGLYVEGNHFNNYIVLRGVSNLAGNGALVGEYIDNADISANGYAGQVGYGTGDVELYDLKRVEVLKGPQGTLYGDGAMGGVIRYITNKPDLNAAQFRTDVSALFTQSGAPSQRTNMMWNVPLVRGKFGLRFASQFLHDGGWVDEPVAQLKNINDLAVTDLRVEALWRPIRSVHAVMTHIIHRESYGIGAGENSQGNIVPVFGITSPPHGDQSFNLSNVTVTANLVHAQLLSSSTYLTHSQNNYDVSYMVPGEVELLSAFPVSDESASEEIRLHSVNMGPWQWLLGGFYKHYLDHDGGSYYFGVPGPLSTAYHEYITGNSEESNDAAVFVDGSVRILNRVTIGGGVRYFHSRFDATAQSIVLNGVPIIPTNRAHEAFHSTDPRVYLQYRVTPHVNTYISAAKGFRSGEPNLGLVEGYDPESLWSYDVGSKLRLAQGHVRINADLFYEKYSNYVGQGLIRVYGIPTFGNFNIGDARVRGVDADIAWVLGRWRASMKGEGVSSEFVRITAADTGFAPGQNLPYVPDYTFAGSLQRAFSWGGRAGFAAVNYSQVARVQHGIPVAESDVIRLLSVKAEVEWRHGLSFAIFGQNLLNDRGYLDPNWNEGAANRPRPRTFGVEFRAEFR